jgi:hypothetical protein
MKLITICLAGFLFSFAGAAQAADASCDRFCLNGLVEQYLAALVAHDPARLPLAKNARYTENGQTLKLGEGMWGPPSLKLGTYKLYFADPQGGQVGFFGTIEEHAHPVILALRLKIDSRKISEMEALVVRKTAGVFSEPQNLVDKPIFTQALAPAERRPREELIRVANSYFEGLEQATEKVTPFDKDCQRIENGVITSNNPDGANAIQKMSCGEQFATGFSKVITQVRDRRFPVVDEERGLVLAIVSFDHSGQHETTVWADGSARPVNPPFDQPFTFEIGELFKIVDGKINRIEALVFPVPYGMPLGWRLTEPRR